MPSMMSAPALSTNIMTRFQGDLGTPADACSVWETTHHQQRQQQQQKASWRRCTDQACGLVCKACESQLSLSSKLPPAMCTCPSPGRKQLRPEPLTCASLPSEAGVAEPAAGQGVQVVHTPRALAQLGS